MTIKSASISITISPKRIGFISTRFMGTDGVSLETEKWAKVLEELGHTCYWFAGKLDTPAERSLCHPLAFFGHPRIAALEQKLFGITVRSRQTTDEVHAIKEEIKNALYEFVRKFQVEVLVPENILSIPMNIPLGMAMTELIAETDLPTIAHHHDFAWERERFAISAANDYLQSAFPPNLPGLEHIVINSPAQQDLARRRGVPSTIIANAYDFENPPALVDDYAKDFRAAIGIAPDDILILQPTRVVGRKGIEHAVDLVRRLKNPKCKLIISHEAGDEGILYLESLKDRIAESGIDCRFISHRLAEKRQTKNGTKLYSLWDVYPHVDLVTYPSLYEGFGNAFLEAVYFRKPLVINRYSIYVRDLEPLGFKAITMDGFITEQVVRQTRTILNKPALREEWAEHNYQLARRHFSYAMLRRKLTARLANLFGEEI